MMNRCPLILVASLRVLLIGWIGWMALVPAASAQPANADALRQATRAALAASFADEMHRLDIQVKRASGEAGTVDQPRVAFRALDELPRGSAQVRVFRREGDRWTRAGWALLYVAHYDSVLVADRTLSPGDRVTRADVRTRWRETTRFRGDPLTASAFERHDALYAARHLRTGRLLRQGDVRPPYAADTGQSVTVQYRRGALQMMIRCKAREPGFVGDVIQVYAPDNDTAYRVRLVRPGRATWIETL
jgi:flagella basal body P-ring formation protein FlgA